jgi:arginase family enzyme
MIKFLGIEYSRGATEKIIRGGPALAPRNVQKMFPNADWSFITPDEVSDEECLSDRFGDAYKIHTKVYPNTPREKHILIGGDHSVNFGHFAAIADMYPNKDICLVYFDAHLDIHTPESSKKEASGAPHGTNVRHLLGEGDKRWLSIPHKKTVLKSENLFYFGTRSFEESEIKYVKDHNIFYRTPEQLQKESDWKNAFAQVRKYIGNKKFVVSFDFDGIDEKYFKDVWVPEPNGLSIDFARAFINEFKDAINFEFVEWAVSGDEQSKNVVKELIGLVAKTFD